MVLVVDSGKFQDPVSQESPEFCPFPFPYRTAKVKTAVPEPVDDHVQSADQLREDVLS